LKKVVLQFKDLLEYSWDFMMEYLFIISIGK